MNADKPLSESALRSEFAVARLSDGRRSEAVTRMLRLSGPVFDRAMNAIKADAWDEGYEAGRDEDDGGGRLHPNPYKRNENA